MNKKFLFLTSHPNALFYFFTSGLFSFIPQWTLTARCVFTPHIRLRYTCILYIYMITYVKHVLFMAWRVMGRRILMSVRRNVAKPWLLMFMKIYTFKNIFWIFDSEKFCIKVRLKICDWIIFAQIQLKIFLVDWETSDTLC